MIEYKLPEPVALYTGDRMREAFAAGQASRDAEVERLKAELGDLPEAQSMLLAECKRLKAELADAVATADLQDAKLQAIRAQEQSAKSASTTQTKAYSTKEFSNLTNQAHGFTVEPKCSDHPDAPHGFDRNASATMDRYVCDCEGWVPPEDWK